MRSSMVPVKMLNRYSGFTVEDCAKKKKNLASATLKK